MFTVTGSTRGVPYDVTVRDDGTIDGSERIEHLLYKYEGEQFGASPTHGARTLTRNDPASILLALRNLTVVSATRGDVPDVAAFDGDDDPSTDY